MCTLIIKIIAIKTKMKKCHSKWFSESHFVCFFNVTKTLSGIKSVILLVFVVNFNIFDILLN
jgi:hypothetical protein